MKSQQKFRSIKHNAFTEKVNKTAFSFNDDKKNTVNQFNRKIYIWKKKRSRKNNTKIVNFDDFIKENIKNIMQIGCKFLIIQPEY